MCMWIFQVWSAYAYDILAVCLHSETIHIYLVVRMRDPCKNCQSMRGLYNPTP